MSSFILTCATISGLLNEASSFTVPRVSTRFGSESALSVATLEDVEQMMLLNTAIPIATQTGIELPTQDFDSIAPREPKKGPSIATWKQRLNTREDKFSLHKWSGLAFTLSSTGILGTGLFNGLHHDIPAFVEPLNAIFYLSVLVQSLSSLEMADSHRRSQPAARDAFKAGAFASIFAATGALINGPFAPDFVCYHKMISDAVMGATGLAAVGYSTLALLTREELINARSDRKASTNNMISDLLVEANYWINSLFTPIVFVIMLAVFLHPEHDRAWLLHFQDEHAGQAASYYGQTYGNTMGMFSFLIPTLRDKKLIGRDLESKLIFGLLAQIPISIAPLIM